MLNSDVSVLLPKGDKLFLRSTHQHVEISNKELGIAQWVYELGKPAGIGTDTLSFSNALYIPLVASQKPIGVLRILPKATLLLTPDQMYLLESCANQMALALEVDSIDEKQNKKELKIKANRIQNELLQNVSHDLRTPLLSVLGDTSTLIELSDKLNSEQIKRIGTNIYSELEQHNRLINNILQISYLESDSVRLQKEPTVLKDIITAVVKISGKKLENRKVNINIAKDFPKVYADNVLLQEVIINLLDNAIKFSTPETPINIFARVKNDKAIVSIEDEGPGIVPDEIDKTFRKYYRGREKFTSERGLGLGLAICQAIINAHGGKIWAENRKEGGAVFNFT